MGIVRTTVQIDKDGMIEQVYDKVKAKIHSKEILDTI